jgi:hypothetical protein
MADDPFSEFDKRSAEGYNQFVRSMPRPAPPVCAFRGCDQLKLKFSPLFCALHELGWIAKAGTPSHQLDGLTFGDAVRWSKNIQT